MKHPELQCSCCGYIPDDEDIKKTNYKLSKCSCGQDNVCDLCLVFYAKDLKDKKVHVLNVWVKKK